MQRTGHRHALYGRTPSSQLKKENLSEAERFLQKRGKRMQSLKELYKIGKGPSSSHTMGPERACRAFLRKCPDAASYRVILFGSLALTGKGHLTDVAVKGVLGEKTEVIFDRETPTKEHPNTMTVQGLDGEGNLILSVTYLSVGGGSIRVSGEEEESVPSDVYPHNTLGEISAYCKERGMTFAQYALSFEGEELSDHLLSVWRTMRATVAAGLLKEGELPGDLHVVRRANSLYKSVEEDNHLAPKNERLVCAYAFAMAEENASGGEIVTAPTCGSCGVLPAVLIYLADKYKLSEAQIIDALATAGIIGNVVKTNASVSGAEAGCQAEIGTATAMAAAAVGSINHDNPDVIEYAAEIALEHQLGLTCDPVHGYVQIPCIERNAVAALRALESANLAHVLAGTRKISFDLIVKTMYETGKDINSRYRETSEGGLASNYNKGC